MKFFQSSVLNKYLKSQHSQHVEEGYLKFIDYFHNTDTQNNILAAKEEQFQEGFLRELFVNIFGYVLNPSPNFNLTSELKNEKGSKKADGAILQAGAALAVIELKGTNTTDLDKINAQAFSYKNNHTNCVYVITSNFKKIRFFIHNAVDYLEFDLFTLNKDDFSLLWLCLNSESLLSGIPLKVKEESLIKEKKITDELYEDYSSFKDELWNNIVNNNPNYDKLLLYKKTQKLLDRMLFILFAEDKGLLPPNSVTSIINQWEKLKDLDEYKPLYERFQKYFGYLNTGRKEKDHEIFAYNGGLFLPDEVLDNIKIDDDIIYKHILVLTEYDFVSEVDVNILGHIFEHSLNEIESITAKLAGISIDKSKSKRKKDGVFYTPKFITKYIVDSTLGRMCNNKKLELSIHDEDYAKGRKNRKKETIKFLSEKVDNYRKWLLDITICDPACGSGAFLNQALEFLINEHRYLDELLAQLLGASIIFPDVANHILEKNLYGVDINEESIEIAKLSLWLRTAQRGRKLTSLNNNIKCGNSLIDDNYDVSNKVFNWNQEFPDVFSKGGFDIVLGNPPYLRVQGLRSNFEKETEYYEKKYVSATGRFDIYVLFLEKTFYLIKKTGLISLILPHKFMTNEFGIGIRKFLLDNKALESIVHFGSEMVFNDASIYTCIVAMSHNNRTIKYVNIKPSSIQFEFHFKEFNSEFLDSGKWNIHGGSTSDVFKKISSQPLTAKSVFENISQGVVSVGDNIFVMKGKIQGDRFFGYSDKLGDNIELEAGIMKPLLVGEDVKRYEALSEIYYIIYPHYKVGDRTMPYNEIDLAEKFPLTYNYFLPYKQELIAKKLRYKTNITCWYSLHRSRNMSLFEQEKIVTPETSHGGNMTLDSVGYYHNTQVYSLVKNKHIDIDNKALIAILNSRLFWFFLKNTGNVLRGGYFRFKTKSLEPFPMPSVISEADQILLIAEVDSITKNNESIKKLKYQLLKLINVKYSFAKINTKLMSWHKLNSSEFIDEIKKMKIKLNLTEELEWIEFFDMHKLKVSQLYYDVTMSNSRIDKLVYQIYSLDDNDIVLIENS